MLVPRDALCDVASQDALTAAAHIKYVAAAAKVAQILAQSGAASPLEDVLLAPMESNVIPLPHQVEALARAVSSDKIRYLLADEVGLGKTLEKAAKQAGAGLFEGLMQEHALALQRETLRGQNAFAARRRGIERVGLPEVRHHRLALCDADEKAWKAELHAAAQAVPELRPLLLMRIGGPAAELPLQYDKATQ